MKLSITTERFILRPLKVSDVTELYLSWFNDPDVNAYIVSASNSFTLNNLKKYVYEKSIAKNVLFLGIFEKDNLRHLGNLKFEPIDINQGFAIVGILIGDPQWRGMGVASEVLIATSDYLFNKIEIKEILLCVSKKNLPAIKAYKKAGFIESHQNKFLTNTSSDSLVMSIKSINNSLK